MNILLVLFLILIIIILFFSLIFYFIFKDDIHAWLFPDKYVMVTMVQLDDSILTNIIKKNQDLTYEFNGALYNLFYPDRQGNTSFIVKDGIKVPMYNRKSTVFRQGRLASFTFIEGQENPIDFRDLKRDFSMDTKIKKEFSKVQISRLISSVSDFENIIAKWWWVIALAIIIIFILITRRPKVELTADAIELLKQGVITK